MICEASSSNPPPAADADADAVAGSASSSSNNLSAAPGFRFQPTDEELVSYYLKRKVCGRPLVVDAIGEIDLYKWEPWDLPSLSRLRTRDMMWYFFSPLDRKYSNRSRTNRATAQGYWKTTGKDRPVHHASSLAGMKKTLVFHARRAPRGKRTNWVMHEYRLEDADSSSHPNPNPNPNPPPPSPQKDSFVLCRIFQKRASGPQNGAQYGAPFIEEEWEETEDMVIKTEGVSEFVLYAPRVAVQEDYVHHDDSEKQVLGFQHERTALVAAETERQDSGSQADDTTISLEELLDLDADISVPGLLDDPNMTINMGENSGMGEQSHSPSDQNDGYLELKDIFGNANAPTSNSFVSLLGVQNDRIIENDVNDGATWAGVDGTDFCFDTVNETTSAQEPTQPLLNLSTSRPPLKLQLPRWKPSTIKKRLVVSKACSGSNESDSGDGLVINPSKIFMEEAIGAEYGEGFETFRMDGPLKVDVDYLNEKLQECFLQRIRHAMKPDEAFGLIFSWDNVVADTRSLKLDAWRQLASEMGKDFPQDAHVQRNILNAAPEFVLQKVLFWEKSENGLEKLKSRLLQIYYGNLLKIDTPMEGLKEWLDALYTAGVPCAIVSCLDRRNMLETLERMGLHKYFQAFVTEEDGMESLAHRFLSAAVKLDRKPSKCVVFEDDPRGVTAAHNCTMMAVALIGAHRAYELVQADLAVASFSELSIINLKRLFANKGTSFMDLQKQIIEKSPPKRKLMIDTIF